VAWKCEKWNDIMTLDVDFTFDEKNYRHYMNGFCTVLHCHHYLGLTTKLAEDFDDIGGTRILAESAEDTIRPVLDDYIKKHAISSPDDRLAVGLEFYPVMGMGKMEATLSGTGGRVVLHRSHVDAGWLKKWGPHNKPINHFTRGYIAAMFGAALNRPARSFRVKEIESIVMGSERSIFLVERS
jgi:hypothetical protein